MYFTTFNKLMNLLESRINNHAEQDLQYKVNPRCNLGKEAFDLSRV